MEKPPTIDGELELEQNLKIQRRVWVSERIGWLLMAAFVAGGLSGVFGSGPVTEARAQGTVANRTLKVDFHRVVRSEAPATYEVRVDGVSGDELRLWVDDAFLEDMRIESMQPEPERVEIAGDRKVFVFAMAAPGKARIELEVEPQRIGPHAGSMGMEGGPAVPLSQFVLP